MPLSVHKKRKGLYHHYMDQWLVHTAGYRYRAHCRYVYRHMETGHHNLVKEVTYVFKVAGHTVGKFL